MVLMDRVGLVEEDCEALGLWLGEAVTELWVAVDEWDWVWEKLADGEGEPVGVKLRDWLGLRLNDGVGVREAVGVSRTL